MRLCLVCPRYSVLALILIIIHPLVVSEYSRTFTTSYAHISDSKVQQWTNPKDNIKIQFSYQPERPVIDTFTTLNFSIQDLVTGEHIKDFTARVVVTNGQRLFKFENITVPNGDFSVKYIFPDDGTHQVILRILSKELLEVASFQVFLPHQSTPGLLDSNTNVMNIFIAVGLITALTMAMFLLLGESRLIGSH